jgi:phosphohistidine phosphatase
LHLLRHAKSDWADTSLSDAKRPLAPRGRRSAARLAENLGPRGIRPGVILCSPALRARETLELLLPALDPATDVRFEPALYGAAAGDVILLLRRLPAEAREAMVVGHNPTLQDLALSLAGRGDDAMLARLRDKFPTAALATLALPGEWSTIEAGGAELAAYLTVKDLGGR